MEVNIKVSKGTKKASNKAKVDVMENRLVNKIDWYSARKVKRRAK